MQGRRDRWIWEKLTPPPPPPPPPNFSFKSPTAPFGTGSAKPRGLSATATFNPAPLQFDAPPVAGAESVTHDQLKWAEGVSVASASKVLLPQTLGEETNRNASDKGAGGRSAYRPAPVRGGDLSPWGETTIDPAARGEVPTWRGPASVAACDSEDPKCH